MTKTWLLVIKRPIREMFGAYHLVKPSMPAHAKYWCR